MVDEVFQFDFVFFGVSRPLSADETKPFGGGDSKGVFCHVETGSEADLVDVIEITVTRREKKEGGKGNR